MTENTQTYHRKERMLAIARWAEVGTQEKRVPLPIEADFLSRLGNAGIPLFIPLAIGDGETTEFHQQVSYLIDAFDGLPARVDVAFDSAWKAFESASEKLLTGNITDRLSKLVQEALVEEYVMEELTRQIPAQSCEFLFKRIVSDTIGMTDEKRPLHQPNRRLGQLGDEGLEFVIGYLHAHYGDDLPDVRRKGAMLMRKAIRGEDLQLGERHITLGLSARSALLLQGLLYTSRNERVHGESFSPFVSSAATIKTYTHPYYSFLSSYYLLLSVWATTYAAENVVEWAGIRGNLDRNIGAAREVFGRHWLR